MRPLVKVAALAIALGSFSSAASAAPFLADYDTIIPKTLENFESFPAGPFPSPGLFDTFSFSAVDPIIARLETVCRSANNCLTAGDLLTTGERTFSDFRPGTKVFGVRLGWVNPDQLFQLQVTVEGKHSTRIFSQFQPAGLNTTLAFANIQGLQSITFKIFDLPGPFNTNYSFDDVITSVRPVAPVPLPTSAWFLLASLAWMAAISRHRLCEAIKRA